MSQAGAFIQSALPPGSVVETVTGNVGGPVGPDGTDNINIVGDGTTILITGNPATHTLTASLIGGGGGGATIFPTDSGSAIESGGVLNILAGNATLDCGSSVEFFGSSDIVKLNMSDLNNNTMLGKSTGSLSMSGFQNAALGYGAMHSATTGGYNTSIGSQAGHWFTTGSYNTLIGFQAGNNYITGPESNNIAIGSAGVNNESNVLRIGNATGGGTQQINKAYICGVDGRNVGSVATVVTEASDQLGTAVITAGTGITVTPGANLITIATASAVSTSFPTDSGTATPSAGVLNIIAGLSTRNSGASVSFSGSSNTIELNVTDANNNTMIGSTSGGTSVSGTSNTTLGQGAAHVLSSGIQNTAIGAQAGHWFTTGSYNTLIGFQAGNNYTTGSESSNIAIGSAGVNNESNVLRIGNRTGGGTQQINKAYICGVDGRNVGSVATVVTEASDQLGTAVITAGTGITVTPGANLITIATTALLSAITSITGDTGGAQTGPAITFAGGTTGLSFGGSSNTITTTFAGITANGGTVSLATDATTSTVNIGTGAGIKTVTLGSTNSSSVTALKYGTGNFTVASASGTVIKSTSTGDVTMPLQPAFLVKLVTSLSNVTGNGTFYNVVFDTLVYDQGSNVNLPGPPTIFTAPVTGIYNFSAIGYFTGLGSAFTDGRINIITTSRQIVTNRINPGAVDVGGFLSMGNNVYTNMTAGDTAYFQVYVGGSTQTIGLLGDSSAFTTYFSGVLVV